MRDTELYRQILGVEYPWEVTEVEVKQSSGEVTIHLRVIASATLHCPECGRVCPGYDHRDRQWRHLDTCEFQTILSASVPRIQCPDHGVRQVAVPWAEAGSSYRLLFETLVIDWLQCASMSEVARLMRLSWNTIDRIQQRAVRRGLQRRGSASLVHLSIDEIAVKKGHAYVTVISDQYTGGVIEVLEERRKEPLLRFFAKLSPVERASIRTVSMDMWPAYIGAVGESIPEADQKICYDRFHIAQHLNRAVDQARRSEHRRLMQQEDQRLKKTRYLWLQDPDSMSDQRWQEFTSLRTSRLKTARAWVLKEEAMSIFEQAESRSEALEEWQWWYRWAIRSRIEPIKKVARMIKAHLSGIINARRGGFTAGPMLWPRASTLPSPSSNAEHTATAIPTDYGLRSSFIEANSTSIPEQHTNSYPPDVGKTHHFFLPFKPAFAVLRTTAATSPINAVSGLPSTSASF